MTQPRQGPRGHGGVGEERLLLPGHAARPGHRGRGTTTGPARTRSAVRWRSVDRYAAWLGPTLLELWRDDLVRTIQYGDLPDPPKPNAGTPGLHVHRHRAGRRAVRHRRALRRQGTNARVVINWATPDSAPNKPDDQDVFKHDPRADIDTGSPAARIVGITADRVAVLVSAPEPAVVVYDATGRGDLPDPGGCPGRADRRRRPADPGRWHRTHPRRRSTAMRYSLIGDQCSGCQRDMQVHHRRPGHLDLDGFRRREPPTSRCSPPRRPTSAAEPPAQTAGDGPRGGMDAEPARWACPRVVGDRVLMPVDGGLAVLAAANGNPGIAPTTIPVDRGGYTGRVDAAAVGDMIIEARGDLVVGLSCDQPAHGRLPPRRISHGSRGPNNSPRPPRGGRPCPARTGRWPHCVADRRPAAPAPCCCCPVTPDPRRTSRPILDPLAAGGFTRRDVDLPGQYESEGPDDGAEYSPGPTRRGWPPLWCELAASRRAGGAARPFLRRPGRPRGGAGRRAGRRVWSCSARARPRFRSGERYDRAGRRRTADARARAARSSTTAPAADGRAARKS